MVPFLSKYVMTGAATVSASFSGGAA